jgi:anti-sigma B factor antagonist
VDAHLPPDLAAHDGDGQPGHDLLLHALQARVAALADPGQGELVIGIYHAPGAVSVVVLGGEMDMSNAAQLTRRVDPQRDGGSQTVIIELSRLEFLDSCGIRELIVLARAVEETGGAFVLAAPTAIVARVLEITNLGEIMTVVASLADALEHVQLKAS